MHSTKEELAAASTTAAKSSKPFLASLFSGSQR